LSHALLTVYSGPDKAAEVLHYKGLVTRSSDETNPKKCLMKRGLSHALLMRQKKVPDRERSLTLLFFKPHLLTLKFLFKCSSNSKMAATFPHLEVICVRAKERMSM
jgi:hypothetical protein